MAARVGVYGGTFDPPHIGHLVGASEAAHACRLDRVIFVVAGRPWQKSATTVSPAEHRLAMTVLATEERSDFVVDRREIERPGPSYTVDTLAELKDSECALVFIAGSDVVADLDSWEQPERVRAMASFAILRRPGTSTEAARAALKGAEATDVDMPLLDVSSTGIRTRVAAGRPISFLVPVKVAEYIGANGLYAPYPV